MAWNGLVGKITFEDSTPEENDIFGSMIKSTIAKLVVTSTTDWAEKDISDEEFTVMHEQLAEGIHKLLYEDIIKEIMDMSNSFEYLYSKSDPTDTTQQEAWMGVMDNILTIKKDMGMQS